MNHNENNILYESDMDFDYDPQVIMILREKDQYIWSMIMHT